MTAEQKQKQIERLTVHAHHARDLLRKRTDSIAKQRQMHLAAEQFDNAYANMMGACSIVEAVFGKEKAQDIGLSIECFEHLANVKDGMRKEIEREAKQEHYYNASATEVASFITEMDLSWDRDETRTEN